MAEKSKEVKESRPQERAVASWRPFEELEQWPSPFEHWPFSGRLRRTSGDAFPWPWAGPGGRVLPALDIRENNQHYAVTVELPGVRKEDVQVELENGTLTIRGEKTSEREEKKEQCRYTERSYGSFSRSFSLPSDADADRLEASFKDGVLSLTIPRTEQTKPRAIAIKS
jgi:HSP20 family protein